MLCCAAISVIHTSPGRKISIQNEGKVGPSIDMKTPVRDALDALFRSNSEVGLHHRFIPNQFGGGDRADDSTLVHDVDDVSHSSCQFDVLLDQQDGETALLEAEGQLLDFLDPLR